MPYGPGGIYTEPTDRITPAGNGPPTLKSQLFAAPRIFPYGLGAIPQIPFTEYEAILVVDRGDQ